MRAAAVAAGCAGKKMVALEVQQEVVALVVRISAGAVLLALGAIGEACVARTLLMENKRTDCDTVSDTQTHRAIRRNQAKHKTRCEHELA